MEYDFEKVYSEYGGKIYRLAYGLAGNKEDAEDITQEVFLKIYKYLDSFRGESKLYTWIYRIVLNISADHIKYRKKLPIYVLTEDMGYRLEEIIDKNVYNNPETILLSIEAKRRCLHCLTECLKENERKVFCLAVTLDLPYKVVAEIMDCTTGYVKGTLSRAKKKWNGYMENRCEYIKKSNPCKCNQWVKFGLEHGWFKKENVKPVGYDVDINIKNEIINLRDLRNIYKQLYNEEFGNEISERIKIGIKNGEWKNIL